MASLKNITREALLQAIKQFDKLGEAAFHLKFGTSPSTKYSLRHNGKNYPSKAIVAAASGLSPKQFSGGEARLSKLLERHGFDFAQIEFDIDDERRDAPQAEEPGIGDTGKPAAYFASGSNRPADIRGFAHIGHAIGVAANELSPNAETELMQIAGSGTPVFVDSGAFSEVEFGAKGPEVVAPISEDEWQDRLDLYARLAAVYAEAGAAQDLHLVAPDQVGSQEVTLARLRRWAPEMRALNEQGVRILVCMQRGAMSQAAFDAACTEVLGFASYVRAMPCKKGATSPAELAAFVGAVQPKRVHLLGLGIKNRQVDAYLDAVRANSPRTVVTLDSNKIAAAVGRSRGSVRPLSAARDVAARLIKAGKTAIKHVQELAIVLAFGQGHQLQLV